VSFTAYATAVAGSVLTAAFWNQQIRDNGNYLKSYAVGLERYLGGDPAAEVTDTTFVPIPGATLVEVDTAGNSGYNALTLELHATAKVAGGTGTLRLYDVTAAAAVTGTVTFTNTAIALVKLTLTGLLNAAKHQYRCEVKGAAATDRPNVQAAALVWL
jgi:hypothetical protein